MGATKFLGSAIGHVELRRKFLIEEHKQFTFRDNDWVISNAPTNERVTDYKLYYIQYRYGSNVSNLKDIFNFIMDFSVVVKSKDIIG